MLDRPLAAVYDRLIASQERRWMGEARRDLLAGLQGDVLEIGAGTGANFQYYPSEARVTAIEPSSNFFKRAESKLAGARASVDLKQADAQSLPFDDDSFDAAVATLVFCTIPDPMAALAEVKRVTKSGAPLLMIEHVRGPSSIKRAILELWAPLHKVLFVGCHLEPGYGIEREKRRVSNSRNNPDSDGNGRGPRDSHPGGQLRGNRALNLNR